MKAFTYLEDKKMSLRESERPRAKDDSAVVKIVSAAICGTDLRTYRFGSERIAAPRIIGHEACGVIQEIGKNVIGFKPGDRVMTVPAIGCGHCRWCRTGATNMCENLRTIGFDFDGTFAEYMEIPAEAFFRGNVLKIDEVVSTDVAVIVEPAACCLNGQSFLKIGPEDSVFIFGAGFIGCVHAELALIQGAKRVIIADISGSRLKIVEGLLPDVSIIDTMKVDVVEYVREMTMGDGADVIITAAPSGAAHISALAIAAKRARISLFGGIPGEGMGFLNSNTIHYKELSIFGSHASTVAQNKKVLSWVTDGTFNLKKYISVKFPLDKIQDAFESLKSEAMLKVLISP
ncbi:MAG: alcohol dehydrogenase catalytic domain-containing protein [Spirochaetes bacterium]|nr:alcohol dehydrogenase catalytic domain-containing protein [Spirochaetota bacterium]